MNIITIEESLHYLSKRGKIAGLDLGTKTIGCAVSDYNFMLASPRFTIPRTKFTKDVEKLLNFFKEEEILTISIGLPVNMNGTYGPRAQATKAFVSNMNKYTDLPFILQDERLSTVEAERCLIEQNLSRQKRSTRIDCAAAAFILQSTLDRLQFLKTRI